MTITYFLKRGDCPASVDGLRHTTIMQVPTFPAVPVC